jgi:phosphoadenosine phosphosulfate reductase
VRAEQSTDRGSIDVLERHDSDGHPMLKVYPLAAWSRDDIWRYIRDQGLPYHPLLDQGYTSIGCWPCTRPTRLGESERAGRWAGTGKTECGLHTFTTKQ